MENKLAPENERYLLKRAGAGAHICTDDPEEAYRHERALVVRSDSANEKREGDFFYAGRGGQNPNLLQPSGREGYRRFCEEPRLARRRASYQEDRPRAEWLKNGTGEGGEGMTGQRQRGDFLLRTPRTPRTSLQLVNRCKLCASLRGEKTQGKTEVSEGEKHFLKKKRHSG